MPNAFEQTELIVKFAVKEFLNNLQMSAKIDKQLDEKNVFNGENGATVYVRRPVMFEASEGAVIQAGEISDIEEATVPVTVDKRRKVVHALTSEEKTLNITDLVVRIIRPSMEELAQKVENDIADQYKNIINFAGTPGTSPSTFLVLGEAGALLDNLGVAMEGRNAFFDPDSTVTLANNLRTVFPTDIARKAIERASIGEYANLMLYKNQSLKIHTVGAYSGTPLIDGNNQNVTYAASKNSWTQTLNTKGWGVSITGLLKAGDKFTIAGVNSVNRRSRETTGNLAQFTLVSDADSDGAGDSVLTISPPIINSGPYQTVDNAPVDNAAISILTGAASSQHRQNMAFHKNCITMASAQLAMPGGGAKASRQNFKGVSMRVVTQYDITLDKDIMRFDIFYGLKTQNPEWGVVITS